MKLTLVMVLYEQKLSESKTYQSFKKNKYLLTQVDYEFIICDNSKIQMVHQNELEENMFYFHDATNPGIAQSYNIAFQQAVENDVPWLLLLDHDTTLTGDYLKEVLQATEKYSDVAAIVPKIYDKEQLISPVPSGYVRHLAHGEEMNSGISQIELMAINSGAVLNVHFLQKIGGFNLNFPLDYLDHWLFFEINERQEKIYVLKNSLQHELSVMDYQSVSLARYQSILDSEIYFYQNFQTKLLSAYKKNLFFRACKQVLLVKNKKIAAYTFKKIFSK